MQWFCSGKEALETQITFQLSFTSAKFSVIYMHNRKLNIIAIEILGPSWPRNLTINSLAQSQGHHDPEI